MTLSTSPRVTTSEHDAMARALALAEQGRGWVEPNPRVGCVILRGDTVLGEGFHARFGGPHAEVQALSALSQAGHNPQGATAVVNLEPCCHHGKTPPCTQALIRAGIGRVICAMVDPDPRVAGQGVAQLREAGVEVVTGVMQHEAERLNAGFIKRIQHGMPLVTLKLATTLDGRTATATGESQWITGEASRRRVHETRASVDAVMVGIGTALADNPLLTARHVAVRRAARRVVMDPELRLPPESALLQPAEPGEASPPPVTLTVEESLFRQPTEKLRAYQDRGIEILPLPRLSEHYHLDLKPLLEHLAQVHAATEILVEGGAALSGAFLSQGLADRIEVYVGAVLIGDHEAVPAVTGIRPKSLPEAIQLRLTGVQPIDGDVLLEYDVLPRG